MGNTELHSRLMDDALRYNAAEHTRGLLTPYRDVLLIWRAKFMSYEQIAAAMTRNGLCVSAAGVGHFCRRSFTTAEIVRERSRLKPEAPGKPAATVPSSGGLSTVAKAGAAPVSPGRRGPRIARDNY